MKTYRHVISNPDGLHARNAVLLARLCRDAESQVELQGAKCRAEGSDVFDLMKLDAVCGDELEFFIDGGDEEGTVQRIISFCDEHLTGTVG